MSRTHRSPAPWSPPRDGDRRDRLSNGRRYETAELRVSMTVSGRSIPLADLARRASAETER